MKDIYISDINKNFSFITKILKSIVPYYGKQNPPKNFFSKWKKVKKCYDSGGFSFLMGNISESQLDPDRTIEIYNTLGHGENDILLQLDLPPYSEDNMEKRLTLIDKNVEYYFYQKAKIEKIIPILHGWKRNELEYHLDKLNGFKSPIAAVYNGCLTKSKTIAVGSNLSLVKTKKVAMGSYLATAKDKKRKVSFEKVLNHILYSLQTLDGYEVIVLGAGNVNMSHILFSLGAQATDGCSWRIDAAFGRIYLVGKTPISFLTVTKVKDKRGLLSILGAKIGNSIIKELVKSSFYLSEQFQSEIRRLSVKYKIPLIKLKQIIKDFFIIRRSGRNPIDEDMIILREMHELPNHPFHDLPFKIFFEKLKRSSGVRAYHNAFVITLEENIARQHENDEDSYFKYLKKRFESYSSKIHLDVLKFFHKRMRYPYIQQNLEIYLRN
ncbi:MAG: hypothetical protein EAX96_06485 [Candidatus Lokiarchaeota archaeon]|nr:hypothetical protein [Candidatus Lokiarchaeota archaeon]